MSQLPQGVVFARDTFGAAWASVVLGAPGAGEVQAHRMDGGPVALSTLPAVLGVEVQALGAHDVFVSLNAAPPATTAEALMVKAGSTSGILQMEGTGQPLTLHIYGHAGGADAQAIIYLGRRL